MKKRNLAKAFVGLACASQLFVMTAFAGDNYITSYAFADIAGNISGNTITVNVPYSTKTTYWEHRVDVSNGATYTAGAIRTIDDKHSEGEITVTSDDGRNRVYTVKINKNDFVAPTYTMDKASRIKSDKATIKVNIGANDARVRKATLYYYTKKNTKMSKSISGTGEIEVELTGLKESTKYYYYLSIETDERTYETSAKTFTTKAKKDTGTSSSSSKNSSSSSSSKNTSKGSSGPGTDAKQNNTKKNQWSFEGGKWYYYGEDGFTKVGWFQVGNTWYYTAKGTNELYMSKWAKIDGKWYFFDGSGAMLANQWIKGATNDTWYWVGPSGSMVTNQEIAVNGVRYLIDPSGVCVSNQFIWRDGRWVYNKANSAGIAVNEAFTYDGVMYHADGNGYVY